MCINIVSTLFLANVKDTICMHHIPQMRNRKSKSHNCNINYKNQDKTKAKAPSINITQRFLDENQDVYYRSYLFRMPRSSTLCLFSEISRPKNIRGARAILKTIVSDKK